METIHDSIQMHNNPNMHRTYFVYTYAPVWKRFVAYFIDMVIILLLTYLFYCVIKMFSFFAGDIRWSDFVSRNWYYFALCIWSILVFVYFTLMPITSFSSTFGQLIMGLKQIDKTGNSISYGRSIGKFFASMLSKIFYIGYFLVYFNPYRQTFHEMLTDTFVVER